MSAAPPRAGKANLREAILTARRWLESGRHDLAERQQQAILDVVPHEVNALFLLGALRAEQGRPEEAESLLRNASRAAPDFAPPALELARLQRRSGRLDDAIGTLEALTARAPGHSFAWAWLGDALSEAGRFEAARTAFRRWAETDPCREEIARSIEAQRAGRRDEAERVLRGVLERDPHHVYSLVTLATIALDTGRVEEAEPLLERARRVLPHLDTVWRTLARLHFERSDYARAEAAARRTVEIAPDLASSWTLLGDVQAWGWRPEAARASFERALAINANQPQVWMSFGHALKTLGEREESEAAYREATRRDPRLGEAYWSLADLKTYRFSEDEIEAMERRLSDGAVTPVNRAGFHFALGKALEDRERYEESFDHYAAGNAIRARLEPFDTAGFERLCDRLKQAFAHALPERAPADGRPTPIFIVGLPRSGSTLIEQILASHSEVEGTMELPHMLTYVRELTARGGYPDALDTMGEAEFQALGRRYLDETAVFRGDAPYFVDKLPNNFTQIGLIARALPHAVIIDARRDALDCCVSAFKQNFIRGQNFTYDLAALGRYYRAYAGLMEHWDAIAPGRVIKMRYEDMVADSETRIRVLLDACGLEFEAACLRFHETRRAVRTASAEQVRQPIYARSVGNWRRFEPRLGPLIEALGDLAETGPAGGH